MPGRERQRGQSPEITGSGKVRETEYKEVVTESQHSSGLLCVWMGRARSVTADGPGEVSRGWVLGGLRHALQGSGDGKDTVRSRRMAEADFCFRRTPLVALYRERDWWLRARVGRYAPEMKGSESR